MNLQLPEELESGVDAALRALPSSQWISAARALSERYRTEREGGAGRLAQGQAAVLGYAALVLPAAYGQLWGAMAALRERAPGWKPATLLDIGSGPGTALWAAVDHWPGLKGCTAWEREPAFLALGRELSAASPHPAVASTHWEHMTLGGALPRNDTRYDLIVLGHLLNELDAAVQNKVLAWAWAHCTGVLLLVEPGTSAGFAVVRGGRDTLLAAGAHTLAPCAHDAPCPLTNDWCHFPQRLERPTFQRRAKGAAANWEDSKFSYAAMARFPPTAPIWGRLIHQPQVDKGGVTLILSTEAGILRPRTAKRGRAAYRAATDLAWGDALTAPPDNAAAGESASSEP